MIEIRASRVLFYSQMDESAFIEWLEKIKSIKDMYGEVDDIIMRFEDSGIPDADFHEIIALYRRYNIDRKALIGLVNDANEAWVRKWEPGAFMN